MPSKNPPAHRAGFTLMELMVVIAIIGLSLSLTVPSWNRAVQKRLVTQAAEEVSALLVVGQSEAIARNQQVSLSFTRVDDFDWCVGASLGAVACDCTQGDPVLYRIEKL